MKKIIAVLSLTFIFCLGSSSSVFASSGSFSVFKTKGISNQTKNKLNLRYSSLKPMDSAALRPKPDLKTNQKTGVVAANTSSGGLKSPIAGLSLSIPKIGLEQQQLNLASVTNMADLDQKMLYKPILDTLTSQPCLAKSSAYIMGHSEPATKSSNNKPAVRVFQDLDKLSLGDTIWMQNQAGTSCQYKITGSQIVSTALNGDISSNTFNDLYFPQIGKNSVLKIQTCVKGSATLRLVLTATMV